MILEKTFRVKILDMKYQHEQDFMLFKYYIYKIKAYNIEEAIKVARNNYLKGKEPSSFEVNVHPI